MMTGETERLYLTMLTTVLILLVVVTPAVHGASSCNKYCYVSDHKYSGTVAESRTCSKRVCSSHCVALSQCAGFNYYAESGLCQLVEGPGDLTAEAGAAAYSPRLCTDLCKITTKGSEYTGSVSSTASGRTCQRWDSQSPHGHSLTSPSSFPDGVLPENYCRNPDGEPGGPWCYTTDPASRWEYCGIPFCDAC